MVGASEVLVSSANRWALVHELRGQAEPALGALLAKLSPVDLVLIEGYKAETHPKLVEELVPKTLSVGEIQKVLQNLLREKVSIRDLVTIFETTDHSFGSLAV